MADDDFTDDNDEIMGEQEEQKRNPGREYQRDLEKKNRKLQDDLEAAQKASSEGNLVRRENAFLKAGIDIEKGVGKLFFKGYEGDLTKEAIIEAASADGLDLVPTSQQREVATELDDLATTGRVASSATGSTPPDAVTQIKQKGLTAQQIIDIAVKAGSTISDEQPGSPKAW